MSFKISRLIAKNMKPHNFGEKLIKPSISVSNLEFLSDEGTAILEHIPLSRKTVSRRIDLMAENIENQVTEDLKNVKFAIQIDETILKGNKALLLAHVRYVSTK